MGEPSENLGEQMGQALSHGYGRRSRKRCLPYSVRCLSSAEHSMGRMALGQRRSKTSSTKLLRVGLKLQEDEIREIGITIAEMLSRLDLNDVDVLKRLESPEYLKLIKKRFRDWSAAESEEKRVYIRNLLSTAAVYRICPDYVVRLFIQWIDMYSEAHFAVIRFVYKNRGCTRLEMWQGIYGSRVRDDSSEADLFKLIVHDLSTGHVMRQHRETNYAGQFIKTQRRRPTPTATLTSAFDDDKPYELTELGTQFVRYTVEWVMPRIGAPSSGPQAESGNESRLEIRASGIGRSISSQPLSMQCG